MTGASQTAGSATMATKVPMATAVAMLWLLAVGGVAHAQAVASEGRSAKAVPTSVDRLALAGVLVSDGLPERALAELDQIDLEDPTVDRTRYWLLAGLAHLRLSDHAQAAQAFAASAEVGEAVPPPDASGKSPRGARADTPVPPMVYVFLGQARFQLEDWRGTLAALAKATSAADGMSAAWLVRAQCFWRLEQRPDAWRALASGAERFPDVPEFRRQRVLLLIDMGLYQAALDEAERFLADGATQADDWVALADAMRRAKGLDSAAVLLEEARRRYPRHTKVPKLLGRVYLDMGRPRAAAQVYEATARLEPELWVEAAELYRRAGELVRALWLNGQVRDPAEKTKQRLALLLGLERFEEACELAPRLRRLGLMGDDSLRYGVAYAHFMTGRFERTEALLRGISDEAIFAQANALRQAMLDCRDQGWSCY